MIVKENAYAKINLYLDVLGRRDDGFHDILSVMHSVSLCDMLTLSCIESDRTEIIISTDDPEIPTDRSNIVYSAVEAYLNYFKINAKVDIHIEKRIPVGAGLGGGSSDAAATLRALNKVFHKGDIDQLYDLAAELGSDVPFCIWGGLCVCVGRGEMLTPVSMCDETSYVISIGKERVSTPKAYAALDRLYNDFKERKSDKAVANNEMIINLLSDREKSIPVYNIFEQVIRFDEIDKIKEIMTKNGAEYTLMSGSGPSVFGKFNDSLRAEVACESLNKAGFSAYLCHSVYPEVVI